MLALAAPYGGTEAQPESSEKLQTASLHEIKAASFKREESQPITSAIANAAASKPEFRAIQAIHIDHAKRETDGGHSRTIDGIDFRKDPEGKFQHPPEAGAGCGDGKEVVTW